MSLLAQTPQTITVTWARLGLPRPSRARDLWRQQDVSLTGKGLAVEVGRHGTCLLRVWP
jgi:hypothetical protein